MNTFLPCPFCGGTPSLVTKDVEPQGDPWYGGRHETFVECKCGCCLFDEGFHEGFWNPEVRAVEAWNKRVQTQINQNTERKLNEAVHNLIEIADLTSMKPFSLRNKGTPDECLDAVFAKADKYCT